VLADSKASYAYVRVTYSNDKESQREKFILVVWICPGCKVMRKAKVSARPVSLRALRSGNVSIFQLSNYTRWRTALLFSTKKIYDGDIMWWSDTTFSIFADLRPCSRCQAGVACLLHRSCRSGKGRLERGSNYCEAAEGERSHRIQGGRYSLTSLLGWWS
jgi:hypothetical protein